MNITKEEIRQVLDGLHADPHTADWDAAIALLQAKLTEPVHTDHPMRHHDRTCPACQDAEPVARQIRFERVRGDTFDEMRKNISKELYAAGDAVLCWVNEGDTYSPFTHPAPKQVPMTKDEIHKMWLDNHDKNHGTGWFYLATTFTRAVEAHHGIGS